MAARRLIAPMLVAAGLAIGCGEDEPTSAEKANKVVDEEQAARRAKVERAVEAGRLPPVALELFRADDTVTKPFSARQLTARAPAVHGRTAGPARSAAPSRAARPCNS